MKVTYKPSTNVTGMRIATIRKEQGLTQYQFAVNLSDYMGRSSILSLTTISALESGRKVPSVPILIAISTLYGVSIEYILGLSDDEKVASNLCTIPSDPAGQKPDVTRGITKIMIPPSMYREYHKRPVFVVFPTRSHQDQWGILDVTNTEIVLFNERINYEKVQVRLFPMEPYQYDVYKKRNSIPMSSKEFLGATGRFWVELKTADEQLRAIYDGSYVYGKNRRAIINVANGEILPVSGFAISYTVYREPYDYYAELPRTDKAGEQEPAAVTTNSQE